MRRSAHRVVALALIVAGVVATHAHADPPALAPVDDLVTPERVDLGEAVRGDTVEFAFEISNGSDALPLHIDRIRSSCGCTSFDDGGSVTLAPGASKRIEGLINLSSLGYGEEGRAFLTFEVAPKQERRVWLRAAFIDAFPTVGAVDASRIVTLPLHERYRDVFESVVVYPDDADTELPATLASDRSALTIELPADGDFDAIDAVMTLRNTHHDTTYRVAQEIDIEQKEQKNERSERTPEFLRNARYFESDGKTLADYAPKEQRRYMIDKLVWAHAEFVPAVATDQLVGRWDESSVRDPDGLLDDAQRDSLLRTIAEHARARAQDDPDAFIALIETPPDGGWRMPEDLREHPQVVAMFSAFAESPVPENADAKALLRQAWAALARHDHLFDEIGVGENGAAFVVRRIRTSREASTVGFSGEHALDREQWGGTWFRVGAPFSNMPVSIEDMLERKPSALFVDAHVLIRLRDGRIANWISMWFYDDDAGRWRNDYMQMSGSNRVVLIW